MRDDDDYDDDDFARRRRVEPSSGGGFPKWILWVGGGVLLLFLLCGGIILGVFFGVRALVANAVASLPQPPGPPGSREATDAEITQAISELRVPRRKEAADRITGWKPIESRRKEVARALEPLLTDTAPFVAPSGAKALGVWGTADNLPALHRQLQSADIFTRPEVIRALGELKFEQSAGPLTSQLGEIFYREDASRALKAIGPKAEGEVIKYLENQKNDAVGRQEACNILGQIGTKNSVPALQQASKDPNPGVSAAATTALNSVNRR
jgi:hypothetical protein